MLRTSTPASARICRLLRRGPRGPARTRAPAGALMRLRCALEPDGLRHGRRPRTRRPRRLAAAWRRRHHAPMYVWTRRARSSPPRAWRRRAAVRAGACSAPPMPARRRALHSASTKRARRWSPVRRACVAAARSACMAREAVGHLQRPAARAWFKRAAACRESAHGRCVRLWRRRSRANAVGPPHRFVGRGAEAVLDGWRAAPACSLSIAACRLHATIACRRCHPACTRSNVGCCTCRQTGGDAGSCTTWAPPRVGRRAPCCCLHPRTAHVPSEVRPRIIIH